MEVRGERVNKVKEVPSKFNTIAIIMNLKMCDSKRGWRMNNRGRVMPRGIFNRVRELNIFIEPINRGDEFKKEETIKFKIKIK